MPKGTIKRLIRTGALGLFGQTEGKDLFLHRSELQGVDFSSLREGQQVEFEVRAGT